VSLAARRRTVEARKEALLGMYLFNVVIARTVPLLMGVSLALVLGRAAHDRCVASSRLFAKVVFGTIVLLGALCLAPLAMKSTAGILGLGLFEAGDYAAADRWFAYHERLGGRKTPELAETWATALNNLGQFDEVSRILGPLVVAADGTLRGWPSRIVLYAQAEFYLGHYENAESVLISLPEREQTCEGHYLLGRLAERHGALEAAARHYERSLAAKPDSFPSAYQLTRVSALQGNTVRVAALRRSFPKLREELVATGQSPSSGEDYRALPSKEFRFSFR
jgi:tetratricopeptide (TPR) repeat protein